MSTAVIVPPASGALTREQLDGIITDIAGKAVAELRADVDKRAASDPASVGKAMAQAFREAGGAAPRLETEKGLGLARVARALAVNRGDVEAAMGFAKRLWGKESEPAGALQYALDSREKALSSTDPGSGGSLVPLPPAMVSETIELLRPASAVMRLNPTTFPLVGSLPIPKITGGATAYYTSENADITPSDPTTADVTLIEKELAALVVFSNRLNNNPSVQIDTTLRDDMVAAIAQRGDLAFIRGNGTSNTPRGIRFWAQSSNVTAATAGNTLTTITGGLGVLLNALLSGNVRMIRPAWLFSGRTFVRLFTVRDGNGNFAFQNEMAVNKTLWGYPFSVSTQIPNTFTAASAAETGGTVSEVMFQDMADIVVGQGQNMQIDASQEAAYVDASGTVRAAFGRNQTVLRALVFHDIVARHQESIAVLTDIDWAAA